MLDLNLDPNLEEALRSIFYVDTDSLREATYSQVDNVHSHASSNGVFYNDEVIVFTNESTYKNWLYYAGYEYAVRNEGTPNQLILDGEFVLVMEANRYNRVGETIEMLMEWEDED